MEILPIFTVAAPSEWQPAPQWMNLHYLLRAERCPRSAALRSARYSKLWNKSGYPDKPSIAALAGMVVHATVARIVRNFSDNGCADTDDPRCSAVLRAMGGFSRILAGTIADIAESLADNPRFETVREWSLNTLQKRIPLLREHVQLQLGAISWPIRAQTDENLAHGNARRRTHSREPLGKGVHFEVEVRDPKLKWRGIVDFLHIGDRSCIIKDFKTGEPSDDHTLQIKVYALLWLHDKELNPTGLPASQLFICYPGDDTEVILTPSEIAAFSDSLITRAAQVRSSVQGASSRANVSSDNCPSCDVRHLCSEFWTASRRSNATPMMDTSPVVDDIQLELTARKGERTWAADCLISNHFPPKTALIVRWSSSHLQFLEGLKPGLKIRLCGALVSGDDSGDWGVVTCGANTDVLVSGA